MNQPLLTSDFSSAASSPLSLHTIKEGWALLWMRLWLNGILWLGWSSLQTTQTFSITAIRLLCLLIPIFARVALLISFKNFSFAFTTWLTVWHKRPTFQLISAFSIPSSQLKSFLAFDLKWETCNSFIHLNTRRHCRLINWRNFSIIVSQGIGSRKARREGERWRMAGQWNRMHNVYWLLSYMGAVHGTL